MHLTIQPTLDGDEPAHVVYVHLRPDWRRPGYWRVDLSVYLAVEPTKDPVAKDSYEGLTFTEAGDVVEATLRGLPFV